MVEHSWWHRLRSAAASGVVVALLAVGGYDVAQVSKGAERLGAVVQSEQKLETQDDARFRELERQLDQVREEVEQPHLHGVPCVCEGQVEGRRQTLRMSLGPDCDARTAAGLERAFPGLRCRPED